MEDYKKDAERLLSGELGYIEYAAGRAHAAQSGRLAVSDAPYWDALLKAQSEGKKVILMSGPAPVELLYAMDCVPLDLDLLVPRLAENPVLIPALMRQTELHVNADVCRLNRAQIGTLLTGTLGVKPDGFVAVPVPCDSAAMTYMSLADRAGAPVFQFDVPMRPGPRSLAYLAAQYDAFAAFLARLTGKEPDAGKLRYRRELTNRGVELLTRNAAWHEKRPCPVSSHLNLWNALSNAWGPTEEFCAMLEAENALCEKRAAAGESPCPGGEKHRAVILHNMLWQSVRYTDWLEENYGTATVADGYVYAPRAVFDRPADEAACRETACRRMIDGATVHGAGASGQGMTDEICRVLAERDADVLLFMGSSGCRHEWAATRMLDEAVQQRRGIAMLTVDTDNTDPNYRSENEVKTVLAEYMDTVVKKR
jgi:benzoyl-CoA reductase/2-hydroxyglutaryl-CoA dehydratase subunit BcrC/BadD/HgdB